jgi:hypothetical protein
VMVVMDATVVVAGAMAVTAVVVMAVTAAKSHQ